jgi:hypothetical protein
MKLAKILVLFFFVTLISCGDDDGSTTQNSIRLDGEPYKVVSPSIVGISLDGEGHAVITFVNGGASSMRSLSIDFEYSTRASLTGTYVFPANGTDRLLDDWLTSYAWYEGQDYYDTHLSTGTLIVKHNGANNYTVTMDLTMDDASEFKGTYKGEFTTQFQDN